MRLADIPTHLHHLQRTPTGMPIPWVNVRGRDEMGRWAIRYDDATKDIAAFYDEDPDAEVDFTRACIQRQRQSMIYGVCQVCIRPLEWGARGLVVSRVSTEIIDLMGQEVFVVSEPWLCPDCSYFAVKYCPALIRRKKEKDMVIVTPNGPEDCQLVISKGWLEGKYEASTKANPVNMWAKVYLFEDALKRAFKP